LEISPDLNKLWEITLAESSIQLNEENDFNVEDIFEDVVVKYWISKDTEYPIKTSTLMKITLNPEDFGESDPSPNANSVTMDYSMNVSYFDYNQPVDIILPQEAQNATDRQE